MAAAASSSAAQATPASVAPSSGAGWQRVNPVLHTLLLGTLSKDHSCQWRKLRGQTKTLLRMIWLFVREMWLAHIKRGANYARLAKTGRPPVFRWLLPLRMRPVEQSYFYVLDLHGETLFPPSRGINVNMMPFVLNDENSLPTDLRHYWPLIRHCRTDHAQYDAVCYLTIQESDVKAGQAQRRPGIHTESPGIVRTAAVPARDSADSAGSGDDGKNEVHHSGEGAMAVHVDEEWWGRGRITTELVGGIFMASTVPNSCRIWDCAIVDAARLLARHGDIDRLREVLGRGYDIAANQLVWFTDLTPHESVPVPADTHRQYFRLVTREIGVWFKRHNTPNPLGTKPPPSVRIVDEDKFA
jgi:hypothetical protein